MYRSLTNQEKKGKKGVRANLWPRSQQHTLSHVHTALSNLLRAGLSKSTPRRNLTGAEKVPESGWALELLSNIGKFDAFLAGKKKKAKNERSWR